MKAIFGEQRGADIFFTIPSENNLCPTHFGWFLGELAIFLSKKGNSMYLQN